jgi:hypothetical protein
MRFDFVKLTLAVDTLLPTVENPLHRAILLNYRRHAILETSGRYEQIFAPDMTVEVPRYRMFDDSTPEGYHELVGPQVRALYKGLVDTDTTVMMLEHERIAVADWGFASEALFHFFMPGEYAAHLSEEAAAEPEATFIVSRWLSMNWPYDERGRMIGEHVWQGPPTRVHKCAPEEIWTPDEVWAALSPGINDPAPLPLAA